MSTYEIVVSTIAASNLLLTLVMLQANRGKAAAAKLDELGREIKAEIEDLESRFDRRAIEQALRIERIDAHAARSPKHEDLGAIYGQLNATRQQVERLTGEVKGEMEQMNANLRMVLNQLMKTL